MERLGYVKGLPATADEMGLNVVKYELFGEDINPLNPAAVLMIKKNGDNCCTGSFMLSNNPDRY